MLLQNKSKENNLLELAFQVNDQKYAPNI
jgi:hypothetical protein